MIGIGNEVADQAVHGMRVDNRPEALGTNAACRGEQRRKKPSTWRRENDEGREMRPFISYLYPRLVVLAIFMIILENESLGGLYLRGFEIALCLLSFLWSLQVAVCGHLVYTEEDYLSLDKSVAK